MRKLFFLLFMLSFALGVKAQDHPSSYNRISMSFRNVNFTGGSGFIGGGFDYVHGFSVSSKLPVYVETGASLAYVGKDEFGDGWDAGYGTINVPVNCVYRVCIPSTKVSIKPFIGLNFKGNIVGSSDMSTDAQEWYNDYDFNRFQLGWQLGVGMEYKKLYLGFNFGTDFVQIAKKVNTNTFNFSIGLNI